MYKPYYQPIYIPFLLNEEQSLTKRIRQVCLFFARTERNREFLLSRFFQSILMFDEEEYYFDANSNTFNLLRFCYPISFLSKPIIGNILFFINISKDDSKRTGGRERGATPSPSLRSHFFPRISISRRSDRDRRRDINF